MSVLSFPVRHSRALCRWQGSFSLVALVFAMGGCGASDGGTGTGTVQNKQSEETVALVDGVGRLALSGCVAFDYFAEVNVGGQALNLLMDSGSTTMAVAGAACSSCQTAQTYGLSSTGKRLGQRVASQYLDGSGWSGLTYSDAVAMGNTTTLATPAVSVDFGVITTQQQFFEDVESCSQSGQVPFDGIFGLGPDAMLASGTTSFLSALTASKKMAADLFALHICDIGGTMFLGGYDASHTSGSPNYTPLIATSSSQNIDGAYAVGVQQMGLGGVDFGLAASSLGPTIIDNGTGLVILPTKAYNKFVSLLEQDQTYLNNFGSGFISGKNASCLAASQGLTRAQLDAALPQLTYTFPTAAGGTFQISLPATSSYLIAGTSVDDTGEPTIYCPSIYDGETTALLGAPAMRSHVVIFDRANGQLGFAPQRGCTQQNVFYHTSGT